MLTKGNEVTKFVNVMQRIKQAIENGTYKEREKLPSEFELSRIYKESRENIKTALRVLEEDDIVVRRPGVGIFVNSKPIFSSGIEQLASVTEMIKNSGKTPGSQFISTEIITPTEEDNKRFKPLSLSNLAQVERVRTADGEPVVYCIDKLDADEVPIEMIHTHPSIFQFIKTYRNEEIDYAVAYIEPIGYHEKISPILNCQPDQALLLLKQVHYTKDNKPILYSANFFRADVFSFYVLRQRG